MHTTAFQDSPEPPAQYMRSTKYYQNKARLKKKNYIKFFKSLIEPEYFLAECTKTQFSYIQKKNPL